MGVDAIAPMQVLGLLLLLDAAVSLGSSSLPFILAGVHPPLPLLGRAQVDPTFHGPLVAWGQSL